MHSQRLALFGDPAAPGIYARSLRDALPVFFLLDRPRIALRGIEAALEISGLNSPKYIWRYIRASEEEVEQALTDLWG